MIAVAVVTIAAGLLTGVAPAFSETRRLYVNPLNAIRGSDRVRQRWRHTLVVFEIATTVALLVSAGAMLASYSKSLRDSPGFDTGSLLSARIDHVNGIRPEPILERLRSIGGVASAEVALNVPYIAIGRTQRVSSHLLRLVARHSIGMLGLGTGIGVTLTFALTRVSQGRGGVFDSPGWQAFVVPILMICAIAMIRHADSDATGAEDQPVEFVAEYLRRCGFLFWNSGNRPIQA